MAELRVDELSQSELLRVDVWENEDKTYVIVAAIAILDLIRRRLMTAVNSRDKSVTNCILLISD